MFKNKTFAKICLWIMCRLRKMYSPLVFWTLWWVWLKWTISVTEKYAAKVIWGEMLHAGSITEFREKIMRYDWLSEPAGGLLDFSYQIPWVCFCGNIPTRLGRDCDDFAELAWRWCEIHNFERIWQIMSINNTFKSAHIITVAFSAGIFVVMSNADRAKYIAAESLPKALECYYPEETVWSVYKSDIQKEV